MNEKNVDMDRLYQALDNCEDVVMKLCPLQAYVLTGLLQMASYHNRLENREGNSQSCQAIVQYIQEQLAKEEPYVGEVIDIGWKEISATNADFKGKGKIAANFSDLSQKRQYQLTLLALCLDGLIVHTSELEGRTDKAVREDIFQYAETFLDSTAKRTIPQIIKALDEDKFLH